VALRAILRRIKYVATPTIASAHAAVTENSIVCVLGDNVVLRCTPTSPNFSPIVGRTQYNPFDLPCCFPLEPALFALVKGSTHVLSKFTHCKSPVGAPQQSECFPHFAPSPAHFIVHEPFSHFFPSFFFPFFGGMIRILQLNGEQQSPCSSHGASVAMEQLP